MKSFRDSIFIACAIALLAGAAAAQQQDGNLYGVLIDNQGEPLPGARVEIFGHGAPQTQFADARGQFRFLGLFPGTYSLKGSLDGFATVEHSAVQIRVGRNTTLEIELPTAVEEVISITTESPLLDERKISTGTTVSQIELDKIPTARDPWTVLTQTPGVLVDRINVGGNESGQPGQFVSPGVGGDDNVFAADGVAISECSPLGHCSPNYYDFDAFEEFHVTTGGSDVSIPTAGVTLNLVTKRGSNNPRGSARYLLTDSETDFGLFQTTDPDRFQHNSAVGGIEEYGFEMGGPVLRDKLWVWGSYGRNEIDQSALDGSSDDTDLENVAIKFSGQPVSANSIVAGWNRGDREANGVGRGPSRPAPTTWNQDGPTEIFKIEDTHVFNSDFYLTGLYSFVDGGFSLTPRGGTDVQATLGGDLLHPVWRNTFSSDDKRCDTHNYQLDGSYFFNTGNLSHELKFGSSYREFESGSTFRAPGNRDVFTVEGSFFGPGFEGRAFGVPAASGEVTNSGEYTAGWLQDTLTSGNWTINAGIRYDLQEGENSPDTVRTNAIFPSLLPERITPGEEVFDWEELSPRVGVTYALGAERKTLLRASFARFAEQLATNDIDRLNTFSNYSTFLFEFGDQDGDVQFDPGEPILGITQPQPTTRNRTAPGTDGTVTDELIFFIEHALLPELVVGTHATWRQTADIRDTVPLLRDATGSVRPATMSDYFLQGFVEGTLPDGSPFQQPVYSLVPGLDDTGATFERTGDREQEYLGLSLTLTKRLSNRWMARGHLTYSEWEWDVPSGSRGFDPNDRPGAGDNDGAKVAPQSNDTFAKPDVFMNSDWSFYLGGMVQVAPDRPWGFNVSGNVNGRQGYPIPYFVTLPTLDGEIREIEVSEDDRFRHDDPIVMDVRIDKELDLLDGLSVTVGLDVFNLLDESSVLQRERNLSRRDADFVRELVAPRTYRFGVRLRWN